MAKVMTDGVRAAIVADLLAEIGVCEVARRYGVSPSTVSKIKYGMRAGQAPLQAASSEQRAALDDLLLQSLEVNLRAQTAIAEHISRPEYIASQPADKLAVLFNGLADKAFRLLEAAHRGQG